jgi:glycosyltransferase involved in cell wall biosynthesis
MSSHSQARVAVVYDAFPHYRKGIIEELVLSETYEYFFFGDPKYLDDSINTYEFKPGANVVCTSSFTFGPFHIQTNLFRALLRHKVSYCIFLGNPRFLSYWLLTPILRLLGKRVYFWSHGWIARDEPLLRSAFKHAFFMLPHALLLYGNRSKEIGVTRGFDAKRMHVIGNSLDYRAQKQRFEALAGRSQSELRLELGLPINIKIIICTARVTQKCRFDLLIHAAAKLKAERREVFLLIVGDGPEREYLSAMATALAVEHRFWGACFDEDTISKLYKSADLTVSPGKVGLTAMHSMAYGTPVISHGNFDHQMPEYEAIVPGVTGELFVENSSDDLARVILRWFDEHPAKPEADCVKRIELEYTPASQRRAIECALQRTSGESWRV